MLWALYMSGFLRWNPMSNQVQTKNRPHCGVKKNLYFGFVTRIIEAVEKLTDLISGGRVLWGRH